MKGNFKDAVQSFQFWVLALSAAGLLYVNYKILFAVGNLAQAVQDAIAAAGPR